MKAVFLSLIIFKKIIRRKRHFLLYFHITWPHEPPFSLDDVGAEWWSQDTFDCMEFFFISWIILLTFFAFLASHFPKHNGLRSNRLCHAFKMLETFQLPQKSVS